MMQGSNSSSSSSRRRRSTTRNGGVAASSVWETRMKMDEMKGGIKVFDGGQDGGNGDDEGIRVYARLRRYRSDDVSTHRRKRMNWRPPEPPAGEVRSSVQLRKSRSEMSDFPKSSHAHCVDSGNERSLPIDSSNVGGEKGVVEDRCIEDHCKDGEEVEIGMEEGRESYEDKEMDLPMEKLNNVEGEEKGNQILETSVPQDVEKKPNSVMDHRSMNPDTVSPPPNDEEEEEMLDRISGRQKRMQGIVDLIMWKDISRSAFVFGFGTFFLLSSSYTKDLNFSLISAISYLGLIYLAIVFLYKSILHRGGVVFDERDGEYIVGEDEAILLVRFLLPCINELLLKIRALFSGDPATTMKLALLLFVMTRCGSSITIWTLAKLVFFGVFTIPKICSSYSVQLARYGKFWLERFRDGWESCTHKKAVAAAIFTVIWNLSSIVARVWAVFMLIVAVRLYQQSIVVEEWNGGEDLSAAQEKQEDSKPVPRQRLGPGPGPVHHRHRSGPTAMEVGSEIKLRKRV